ncbi:hypothetical protein [Sediminibacterium ginsengisoli]|uniref:Uncharacterized protein n=1 Tax=Sediminibacterium ginsengisoli TaxID=413434 RepID=A0A1T4KUC8_9BACT|nr:hypothetical protein [Sediminibacterium ginsengisoli]SJZ46052.1 hypothetical protein SAMN04488132_102122 [Sediminibacterium ginsengisoli]
MKYLLSFLFFCISHSTLQAQEERLNREDSLAFEKAMSATNNTPPVSMAYSTTLESKADSATRAAMVKTEAVYHQYMFTQRMAIHNWQLLSGKILFFIVTFIVLAGLFLSYLQFRASMGYTKQRLQAAKENANIAAGNLAENLPPSTKFEITKEGIKIDSAVIGLVILTISIVFFFLYLRYVFPIQTPAN